MFQAQMLIRGASTDTKVFSPWMDRQGDYLRATSEFVAGNGELTVKVYTKNKEETGDGDLRVSPTISQNTPGRSVAEWSSLKELVRYEFTVGDASGEWVLFRMLNPVWFDAVKA